MEEAFRRGAYGRSRTGGGGSRAGGDGSAHGAFASRLAHANPDPSGRRWIFVAYDQLTDAMGPLSREDPRDAGIVLVENPAKAGRRPYHKQKLALVLANLRHFALEQAARGVAVRHVVASGPYRDALRPLAAKLGPLRAMEPAERELRLDLAPLVDEGALEILPHEGWLTTPDQFRRAAPQGPPWRMDAFYRLVRRETGVLMEHGAPAGGKFSFDPENRKPWNGEPPAPEPPSFTPDPVTLEVEELVATRFAAHPGTLDLSRLPATRDDAESLWTWARDRCLPHFGPYEDAMSTRSSGLFHTRISALVNLHRLLPRRILDDALALALPLASKEGFVRQVLGWREFVRHVHLATDGFRAIPGVASPVPGVPGDGGYGRWRGEPWPAETDGASDGGAAPSFLGAEDPLPPAFWGAPSGLACLDRVIDDVWHEAYGHHITRLMILGNLGALLGVSPRELTDWFWVAYQDAYDWVVEPNVLGMAAFAAGDVMTTKPYVAGAAYIDRMSDYCRMCAFHPGKNCPITKLYWAFLARVRHRVEAVPRLRPVLRGLARRSEPARAEDAAVYRAVRERLAAGERLSPETMPG